MSLSRTANFALKKLTWGSLGEIEIASSTTSAALSNSLSLIYIEAKTVRAVIPVTSSEKSLIACLKTSTADCLSPFKIYNSASAVLSFPSLLLMAMNDFNSLIASS